MKTNLFLFLLKAAMTPSTRRKQFNHKFLSGFDYLVLSAVVWYPRTNIFVWQNATILYKCSQTDFFNER